MKQIWVELQNGLWAPLLLVAGNLGWALHDAWHHRLALALAMVLMAGAVSAFIGILLVLVKK